MILIQTKALFVDAYRELNARKLFWITLALNLIAVGFFGALGINDRGPSFLHWTFDNEFFNTSMISRELFYKYQFTTWGIPFWLSWVVAILALISTAGMFPDLISGGVIETMLSRPISRARLFLTKYLAGLLFVALQVLVFSGGSFLVIWIRGGAFEPRLFLAVPIVVLFFSYLFAFCALLGMVTRSTIAALLVTLLFWFVLFITNTADGLVILQRETAIVTVEDARKNIENQEVYAQRRLEQLIANGTPPADANGEPITDADQQLLASNPALRMSRERLETALQAEQTWRTWGSRVVVLKTVLPKLQETIALLQRSLITKDELERVMRGNAAGEVDMSDDTLGPGQRMSDPRVQQRTQNVFRERSLTWVIGTSLLFEGVLLALCALIFSRRDF